jgi:hypothetical protein
MIVRDIDVLARAAQRASVAVTFSVPTLDHEIWRRTEPGTAPPRQRLRALKQLVDAGIQANVGMAPILPGLSDKPELMADVVRAAREAGATGVWANLLNLKPGTKEHFLASLERDWPELVPEYERLYEPGVSLEGELRAGARARARVDAHARIRDRRRAPLEPPEEPEQLLSSLSSEDRCGPPASDGQPRRPRVVGPRGGRRSGDHALPALVVAVEDLDAEGAECDCFGDLVALGAWIAEGDLPEPDLAGRDVDVTRQPPEAVESRMVGGSREAIGRHVASV